ncbi:HAMP domain-containing sensor histidine kinase [Oscillospiraceae bacterium MB08-C2-2]|nr:HAMP domain-containing sensor histidine kinase [Oscillospiraceae bacterium MB08-C2-2]
MRDTVARKQQLKHTLYNFIAFSFIFAVFGLILFFQLQTSIFSKIDRDLERAHSEILDRADFIEDQTTFDFDAANKLHGEPPQGRRGLMIPPRITPIVRDSSGTIQNQRSLGRIFYESDLALLSFSPAMGEKPMTIRLENQFYYRCITFPVTDSQGVQYYVQLVSNVDGERSVVDHFLRWLLICLGVFIPLSIGASYVLSQQTMRPVLEAWKRQTEFVQDASHELRTPLTVIQNKLETLLTMPDARILEQSGSIVLSLTETRRLTKLTADLMTLARSDSGQTMLEKETLQLDEIAATVAEPYIELAELQSKVMELQLGFGGSLCADRGRIQQLLVILMDNALKYTEQGDTITVSTRGDGNWVSIQVRDTGIGISEAGRSRVFDRFYREDKARSRAGGGTGLGLSIAKWIVEQHVGSIKIEANYPKGTAVTVKLPH